MPSALFWSLQHGNPRADGEVAAFGGVDQRLDR
jgi:hypothetical protein